MTHIPEHTPTDLSLYEGCGNRFIIAQFDAPSAAVLQRSPHTLAYMQALGYKTHSDSVMVLTPTAEADSAMAVFEPHAYQPEVFGSGWSTMCGNGIRAVAEYLSATISQKDIYTIQTGAGIQRVSRGAVDGEWRVDMGFFIRDARLFSHYVSEHAMRTHPSVHIGLHSQNRDTHVDGEPHAIVFTDRPLRAEDIHAETERLGQHITHDVRVFPREINLSVVSGHTMSFAERTVHVHAATYERNIYYVTQACGTAATVIGAFLFERLSLWTDWTVAVHMPGGILAITTDAQNRFYLTGDVRCVGSLDLFS